MGIKTTFGIIESSEFEVVSVRPSVHPSVRPSGVRPASVRPSDVRKILCNELVLGFSTNRPETFWNRLYIYIEDVHLPF